MIQEYVFAWLGSRYVPKKFFFSKIVFPNFFQLQSVKQSIWSSDQSDIMTQKYFLILRNTTFSPKKLHIKSDNV